MKTLFGGSDQSSSQSSSSKTGYSALPKILQDTFTPIGKAIGQYANPNNPGVTNMFTPMGVQPGEQNAINHVNAGFAPTADSIKSDMAMQMNPYDSSVIDTINRQGQGDYSVLKQAMDAAGQSGSNRTMLGANDIDLSRMNQIGSFLNGEFNTSMQNSLTTLPQARATDAQNQMSIGDFLRNLDLQTKQAPISALNAATGLMSPFLQGGTTNSSGGSSGSSSNGIIPGISGFFA